MARELVLFSERFVYFLVVFRIIFSSLRWRPIVRFDLVHLFIFKKIAMHCLLVSSLQSYRFPLSMWHANFVLGVDLIRLRETVFVCWFVFRFFNFGALSGSSDVFSFREL